MFSLVKKDRISGIQLKDEKKCNKQKHPSEHVSIPLRTNNKIIMGSRGVEASGWEI